MLDAGVDIRRDCHHWVCPYFMECHFCIFLFVFFFTTERSVSNSNTFALCTSGDCTEVTWLHWRNKAQFKRHKKQHRGEAGSSWWKQQTQQQHSKKKKKKKVSGATHRKNTFVFNTVSTKNVPTGTRLFFFFLNDSLRWIIIIKKVIRQNHNT